MGKRAPEDEVSSSEQLVTTNLERLREDLIGWKKTRKELLKEYNITESDLDAFMATKGLFQERLRNSAPLFNKLIDIAYEGGDVRIANDLLQLTSKLFPVDVEDTNKQIHVFFATEPNEEKDEPTAPNNNISKPAAN